MTIERSATILSLDARWFVAAWVDIREEERARVADAWTAITKIEEWCDDPTYVTEMIDLFEQLTGNRLSPPVPADIPERVKPALTAAVEDGLLAVVRVPFVGRFEQRTQEGIHERPAALEIEPPRPSQTARPSRRTPEKERIWIDLVLIDADGKPVTSEPYRIVASDGRVVRGNLNTEGEAEIDGLPPGPCEISFPELDGSEWLPGIATNEDGSIHIVEQGEHASHLAADNGFRSIDPIWNHPRNAMLRSKRLTPNVLAPGDEIFIPVRKPASVHRPTIARHRFQLRRDLVELRVRLEQVDGHALTRPARLTIEGRGRELAPNGQGIVALSIEPTDEEGTIQVDGRVLPIAIGSLDPISEPSGVEGRLINLGYFAGPLEDADARERRMAIEEFQLEKGLEVTGLVDAATQNALATAHGA